VPPAALPAFLDRLGGLGRVGRHSTTADDRTDEVIDTEAKQRNMAEFRDSLRRMLATPGARLKDLIEVERELTRVQSDLDSLATRRKTLANDTDKVRVAVSFGAVPSEISPFIQSDHGAYPGTQVANAAKWVLVIGTLAIAVALATYGKPPARYYLRTLPVVFVGFFVFLTLLLIRHIPIATGYYYGAMYAVLFAVFVGLCYGAFDTASPVLRATAAATVLFLVIVGASNFSQVNRGWITTHNETLVRGSFQSIVQLSEPRRLRRGELLDIWHAWKDGNLAGYLDVTPISTGAVYLVAELQALDKVRGGPVPPRHVLVDKTGY